MEILTPEHIIALLTAMTAFILAIKPLRFQVKKLWRKTLGRRKAQLDRIEAELRPNGSTSMRDAIDRIELKQGDFDAFLNASLNIHDVAILRTDLDGQLFATNRQYQRLTGYSVGEVSGEGWINTIHPSQREKVVAKWKNAVKVQIEFSEDILFIRPDGKTFEAHANVFREIDSSGLVRGYLGVIIPLNQPQITCPHMDKCLIKLDG